MHGWYILTSLQGKLTFTEVTKITKDGLGKGSGGAFEQEVTELTEVWLDRGEGRREFYRSEPGRSRRRKRRGGWKGTGRFYRSKRR
jgi:hypothetical protein